MGPPQANPKLSHKKPKFIGGRARSGKQRMRERERCRHDNWQRKSKRERPLEVRATVSPLRHALALSLALTTPTDGWIGCSLLVT